jgi:hypothetical protein
MHSGLLPGPLCRLTIAQGRREHLRLLSRCLDHRILKVGQTTCSARPVRTGKGSYGTLVERRSRSVPQGHARHHQALLALALWPGDHVVAGQPYATIDELVSRQVLTRSTFSQIKDQITAN